ncbi:response regulator [Desulfovibrio sp. JC010]|uniref:response regulator n=1 Tax=Desulfovibrio sp. JC010 TaxID=2593641 RepID=UPI0013D128ED|nr:response regulator [Desulfovibrio sp. JC010]NDV25781.1 response regulator [Desulfovibrio sp. JC010]
MKIKFILIRCLLGVLFLACALFFAGDNWLPVLLVSAAGLFLIVHGGLKLRDAFLDERSFREEQLYSVVGNSGAAFYMTGPCGKLLFADGNCRSLERKLAAGSVDKDCPILLSHLADESAILDIQAKLSSGEGIYEFQTEHNIPGGERLVLNHTLQEIYSADGSVSALAGTIRDVSPQHDACNALAREERYLETVMNGADEAVFVHDLEGNFLKVNKVFSDFAGAGSPELCKGTNLHNYLGSQVAEQALQGIRDVVASGEKRSIQAQAINSNGEQLLLDMRGYLCRDEYGEPEAIVGFARKAKEQDEACAVADGADPALMQVLCHEMRTPLAGIIGSLHVLDKMDLAPEAKGYVHKCVVSAERFKDVVNHSLSGLTGKFNPAEMESLDPAACFGKAVELFLPAVSIQNRNITLSIGSGLPDTIMCSRKGLSQTLFCLINNGLEFFPDSDVAAGVKMLPSADSASIISFYVSGTGHNAGAESDIYVECLEKTVDTIGAELYFHPGKKAELGFSLKLEQGVKTDGKDTLPVQDLRILLAEDDISSQVFMRKKLEGWGHLVRTAATGIEVLNHMEDQDYDLVLMDLQMPEMNGFDAIASIRDAESPENRIPIIVMSAYGRESDFQRMSDLGVDDYIAKPVSTEELEKALERLAALGRL